MRTLNFVVNMDVKKCFVVFGIFMILLMMGLSSAVSRDEYKGFLKSEIIDYFDGEDTLLELSELKIAVNYYFESPSDVMNFGESGLSSESIFAINSAVLVGESEVDTPVVAGDGNTYLAKVADDPIWGSGAYNCSDTSIVSEWYKENGRCGANAGLNYWNAKLEEYHDVAMAKIDLDFQKIRGNLMPNRSWQSDCSPSCGDGDACIDGSCIRVITSSEPFEAGNDMFDTEIKMLYKQHFDRDPNQIGRSGYSHWWAAYKSYGGGYDFMKVMAMETYSKTCYDLGFDYPGELDECNDAIGCEHGDDYISNSDICRVGSGGLGDSGVNGSDVEVAPVTGATSSGACDSHLECGEGFFCHGHKCTENRTIQEGGRCWVAQQCVAALVCHDGSCIQNQRTDKVCDGRGDGYSWLDYDGTRQYKSCRSGEVCAMTPGYGSSGRLYASCVDEVDAVASLNVEIASTGATDLLCGKISDVSQCLRLNHCTFKDGMCVMNKCEYCDYPNPCNQGGCYNFYGPSVGSCDIVDEACVRVD